MWQQMKCVKNNNLINLTKHKIQHVPKQIKIKKDRALQLASVNLDQKQETKET